MIFSSWSLWLRPIDLAALHNFEGKTVQRGSRTTYRNTVGYVGVHTHDDCMCQA